MQSFHKNPRAFTLIEMMVSITIFTIIATIGTGALLVLSDAYGKAQAEKDAVEALGFVLESISREIKIGTNYSCDSGTTTNCASGDNEIYFDSFGNRGRFSYYLQNNIIYRNAAGVVQPMTSINQVRIDSLTFRVTGVGIFGENPQQQPFVLINVGGTILVNGDTFDIQTSVSQRTLEKESI